MSDLTGQEMGQCDICGAETKDEIYCENCSLQICPKCTAPREPFEPYPVCHECMAELKKDQSLYLET